MIGIHSTFDQNIPNTTTECLNIEKRLLVVPIVNILLNKLSRPPRLILLYFLYIGEYIYSLHTAVDLRGERPIVAGGVVCLRHSAGHLLQVFYVGDDGVELRGDTPTARDLYIGTLGLDLLAFLSLSAPPPCRQAERWLWRGRS